MGVFKAIITFVIGMILSFVIGSIFNSGDLAITTAVCYVGAIIVGVSHSHEKYD